MNYKLSLHVQFVMETYMYMHERTTAWGVKVECKLSLDICECHKPFTSWSFITLIMSTIFFQL